MDDRERHQFADDLLDAAPARHRSVEPRPGLEERVLTRLRSEQPPASWLGWTWRLAVGVAGFAIVLATAHWARRTVFAPGTPARGSRILLSETSKSAASASPLLPDATKRVAPLTAWRATPRTVRQATLPRGGAEPRQGTFPSPAPLSEQERLLMSYARLSPSADSLTFHAGDREIEEIQIKPLEIAPLETLSPQSENVTN